MVATTIYILRAPQLISIPELSECRGVVTKPQEPIQDGVNPEKAHAMPPQPDGTVPLSERC